MSPFKTPVEEELRRSFGEGYEKKKYSLHFSPTEGASPLRQFSSRFAPVYMYVEARISRVLL